MRRIIRVATTSFLVGVLALGAAWAGSGLSPVNVDLPGTSGDEPEKVEKQIASGLSAEAGEPVEDGWVPPQGMVLAGASKISIEPRPEDFGGTWERDYAKCATLSENFFTQLPDSAAHVASAGSPWPENPNCIYMGGYGIGPMFPITEWDQELGLWVRTFAVSDGTDELVLTIVDGEGYFWDYASKCDDCGAKEIAQTVGAELGIDPAGIVIAATHAHTAPDFIGGWGFVPDWYMEQVSQTIADSITEAVQGMRPAVLEAGEVIARPFNSDRRDTYRSAEEQELTWLRAIATNTEGYYPPGQPEVIATVGAYAGHPTTREHETGVAHADWPGVFEKKLEDRFGGIGLHFMTGLGNLSASGGTQMGDPLAGLIPETGGGMRLTNTDIRVTQTEWDQPVTNVPLTALGAPGFFDHPFNPNPASVRTGKSPDTAPCLSASPTSVRIPASAARIGDAFAVTAGPGELFANLTNTIKEKSRAVVTMPLAQANDALGYMPQSFELNEVGQQGLGFAIDGVVFVNYEDSYSIDRCFGDMTLETTLELLENIR